MIKAQLSLCLQVDEYLADPNTMQTNRMIAQSYKDGLARGTFIQPTSFPHFIEGRPDQVMYYNKLCDVQTASSDRLAESHESDTKSNI